jgi:hypothetical protein
LGLILTQTRLWEIGVLERIRCFKWLLEHDRVLTNSRLSSMHLGAALSVHCKETVKTSLHVKHDCPIVMAVRLSSVQSSHWDMFFAADLQQWIDINLQGGLGGGEVSDWPAFWGTVYHSLLAWRNKLVHDDELVRPTNLSLEINRHLKTYSSSAISATGMNSVKIFSGCLQKEVGFG